MNILNLQLRLKKYKYLRNENKAKALEILQEILNSLKYDKLWNRNKNLFWRSSKGIRSVSEYKDNKFEKPSSYIDIDYFNSVVNTNIIKL